MSNTKPKKQKNESVDLFQLECGIENLKDRISALADGNTSDKARLQITIDCKHVLSLLETEATKAMLRCSTKELSVSDYLHRFTNGNEVQQFLWGVPPSRQVAPLEEAAQALIAVFSANDDLQYLTAETVSDATGYRAAIFESLDRIEQLLREVRLIELNAIDHRRKQGSVNGGVEAGKTRRENSNEQDVIKKSKKLLAEGRPRREIAGMVALLCKCSDRHVRAILKKAGI